jgi:chromatin remodeling complex protein RSC6
MARTLVTSEINTYIRENNLKDPTNGRQINADAKLAALLQLKADDKLTYFNLQRYMRIHFEKSPKAKLQEEAAAKAQPKA